MIRQWKQYLPDLWLGLAVAAVFYLLAYKIAAPTFYGFETATYDNAMRLANRAPHPDVKIVAIDDRAIRNIGRWPWTRDILASVIDRLHQGGARLVVNTILLSESELDPGYDSLQRLRTVIGAMEADGPRSTQRLQELRLQLEEEIAALDYDGRLLASIAAANNVILPYEFIAASGQIGADSAIRNAALSAMAIAVSEDDKTKLSPLQTRELILPLESFTEAAAGLGFSTVLTDDDGTVRRQVMMIDHTGTWLPSLALTTAIKAVDLEANQLQWQNERTLSLGDTTLPLHAGLSAYNYFYTADNDQPAFETDSFYDLFVGDIPVDKYRNKIVILGATATGLGDDLATPVSSAMAPVEVLAHTVSSLLQGDFNRRPTWAGKYEAFVFVLLTLYLMLLLPRLRPRIGIILSALILLLLIGIEYFYLLDRAVWLRLVIPAIFLVVGHVVMTARRFLVTDRLRTRSESESAESNKMLGLTLQSQGQLDMAFEKFRRCPIDEDMMNVLYNLGLDFERKRQFNKANSVYRHIADHNPDYRDLRDRLTQNQNLQQTMILSAGGGRGQLVFNEEGDQRPMLGRYEIEKEIGRGAMGTVYLGRDPKINRVVAVKVIPLAAEFDDEELAAAKDRFFREAETAGRLNHPDIVTIYDVGEEHDLAYIAMELLTGDHLNGYIKPDKLLPPEWVIDIIARAADALDYAHKQKIVHRDIKPANIMFDGDTNKIKITDFGIARITDSSRTKTGIVLGTPSYMSPEQLAGEKVTGRSDIFSLAVTLYQLLSGQLPFQADSMATLMYKIANEPPTPLLTVMPTLPGCLGDIIERALAKNPKDRYKSGAEMAIDLRRCRQQFEQSS